MATVYTKAKFAIEIRRQSLNFLAIFYKLLTNDESNQQIDRKQSLCLQVNITELI